MIYFAQLPTGSIKIGYTSNLDQRMGNLGYHYGDEPAILHTMPGDRQTERELHERFGHLRFGRTEQFRPGPELMEFIGKPLLVGANPDVAEAATADAGLSRAQLEVDLITKAKMIAADQGKPLAGYLSDSLRSVIERDWAKVIRKMTEGGER